MLFAGKEGIQAAIERGRAGLHQVRFNRPNVGASSVEDARIGLRGTKTQHDVGRGDFPNRGTEHHALAQIRCAQRFVGVEDHDVPLSEVGDGRNVFLARGGEEEQPHLKDGSGGTRLVASAVQTQLRHDVAGLHFLIEGGQPSSGKPARFSLRGPEFCAQLFEC